MYWIKAPEPVAVPRSSSYVFSLLNYIVENTCTGNCKLGEATEYEEGERVVKKKKRNNNNERSSAQTTKKRVYVYFLFFFKFPLTVFWRDKLKSLYAKLLLSARFFSLCFPATYYVYIYIFFSLPPLHEYEGRFPSFSPFRVRKSNFHDGETEKDASCGVSRIEMI